jgi:tetratricopeptide (TPR) repeat protein
MEINIEQNQLLKSRLLLRDGKIEKGLRLADQLIKQKYKAKEVYLLIKKTLIKKRIIDKKPDLSKLENLIKNQDFACAKYLFLFNSNIFSKSPKALFFAGTAFSELNEIDEAIRLYEMAIKLDSTNIEIRKKASTFYMSIGDLQKAIHEFNFIKNHDPLDGENHRLLSRSKKYMKLDDPHIKEMEKLRLNPELSKEQRININFALGNIFENLKSYKKSVECYELANNEQDSRLIYDSRKEEHISELITKNYNLKTIKQLQLNRKKNRQIFILGMPRSGTTLVEQILSSHPDVFGGGELPFIENYLLKNRGSIGLRMPKILINPSEQAIEEFYNYYNESLDSLNYKKKYITDKMPGNFKWIGLIKSAFPNSKIIHVTRNIKDNFFSIYKSYFANDTCTYAYNPKNIVNYFNIYTEIMKIWKKLFNDEIYECKYEDLVDDYESESKNILNFCDLAWDNNVINYFNNKRKVLTVSSAQVREKIYNSSINSWINYKDQLEPYLRDLK